ncbi:hypothetical protein F5Y14DRAFT_94635 [Nemania sp. NC0429]|nr:hypothetical protein F5Y14DRAFT_94635 [Nemania sp. NC0429]
MADYSKMKVVELKAELKRLGLPQGGLKAELVSRLEEAAAATESPSPTSEPPAEVTATAVTALPATTEPNATQPSEDAEPTSDAPQASKDEPTQELQAEPATAVVQDTSGDEAGAQMISNATISETPSLPAAEVAQDGQKRKRRSTTPPPADEAVRKRLRPDDSDMARDTASDSVSSRQEPTERATEHADPVPAPDVSMDVSKDEGHTYKVPDEHQGLIDREPAHFVDEAEDTHMGHGGSAAANISDSRVGHAEDSEMADATTASLRHNAHPFPDDGPELEARDVTSSPSPEPDIDPSLHPATCALYIKNFMRPLRPQAVQDHLLELATPANAPLDPSIIVNFYLDNIRTHAFAVFASVSAASRVRTALHKRVWPDETNRKALWIDFIPRECFDDWIDIEQQARNRGNMPRYEVIYDRDSEGNVVASLEETDANQTARRGPVSPVAQTDRKISIPTGPSLPSGIENAPTGPRNPYSYNGPSATFSGRQDRSEQGFIKTKSGPPILYRPVAADISQRRLDCLSQAKDQYYIEEPEKDKEYHRYYFEREDVLVNRGPEIFLGIRPPHREKERRELARAGGIDSRGGRGYRDRRGAFGPPGGGGGGGGGGRRRRRAPRAHGFPRGGDRFRPGSSYDDRSTFEDRRPPRYHGYGESSHRKDNYRY